MKWQLELRTGRTYSWWFSLADLQHYFEYEVLDHPYLTLHGEDGMSIPWLMLLG